MASIQAQVHSPRTLFALRAEGDATAGAPIDALPGRVLQLRQAAQAHAAEQEGGAGAATETGEPLPGIPPGDMARLTTLPASPVTPSAVTPEGRKLKFRQLLNAPSIDLGRSVERGRPPGYGVRGLTRGWRWAYRVVPVRADELRKLSWSGIPDEFRPFAWKILMVRQRPQRLRA